MVEQNSEKLTYFRNTNSIHYYSSVESNHVFVYNNTEKNPGNGGKKSVVILPVAEHCTVKVPATKLPIDLTEMAPKETLLKSQMFMDTLAKGLLLICSEEEAFKILSAPDTQKELALLKENKIPTLNDMFSRPEVTIRDENLLQQQSTDTADVNLTVMECISREDISDDEKFITIKNIEDTLTKKDWDFVFSNSKDELKEYALKKSN